MYVENKVIIWGPDDVNMLGLVRQLGEANIDFLFIRKGRAKAASRSKYIKKVYECRSNEMGLKYLIENYKNEKYKPIIITSGDGISVFINLHKDILEKYFVIPGCSVIGNVEKYTDKNIMTALAKEVGILCPNSKYIKKESSIEGINYPCFIKPSHQKPGHYNEFKFRICNNKNYYCPLKLMTKVKK